MQIHRYPPGFSSQQKGRYSVEAPEYDLSIQDQHKEDPDDTDTTYYFDSLSGAVAWMEDNDINDFRVYWHSQHDGTKHLVLAAGSCINP